MGVVPTAQAPLILVVEDEWLIADMIEHALDDAGYRTLGPAATSQQALALIARQPCDAALLDLNLGGDKSFAVIDRLVALRTPHLLVTGYCATDLPERYRNMTLIPKPLAPEVMIAALNALLGRVA